MSGFALLPAARAFAAALAICLLCAPAHSQSAINTTNLVGVPLSKPIRSMKDLRYASIVRQPFDYNCGAAALAMLPRHGYRIDIPDTELIRRTMAFSHSDAIVKNGSSMLDIEQFGATPGLRGYDFANARNGLVFAVRGQSFVESGFDKAALF